MSASTVQESLVVVTIATGLPGAWNLRPLEPETVFSSYNVYDSSRLGEASHFPAL